LVDASVSAGEHLATWDGRDDAGHLLPAGIYFYRLEIAGAVHTRRLVLMH
jgi:flagellar hook assembly protein FlgD